MSQFSPIVNNFERIKRASYPAYIEGADQFYYFNTANLWTDAEHTLTNYRLALFDQYNNNLVDDLATLTKDGTDPYTFYFTFNIDVGVANNRICRFVIYDPTDGNKIKWISNGFRVISVIEAEKWVYVQYRNSYPIFNYNYDATIFDTSYNTIWLRLNLVAKNPEDELEFNRQASDGKTKILKGVAREVLKLESYNFDNNLNDLMKILPHHDDVLLNGLPVISKQSYQVAENKFNSLKIGTWEVYNEEYSTINLN